MQIFGNRVMPNCIAVIYKKLVLFLVIYNANAF